MTPLRNYVLLTFLSDEEEVTGSGLIIAGSRAVQRARVLECGADVSAAVKGAHVVVLRKNNTAVQVNGVARNTYLVQETDILAVERTLEDDRADELLEEIEALRKENATLRCPPPADYILDDDQPSAFVGDIIGEVRPLATCDEPEPIPEVVPLAGDGVLHPDGFPGSDYPDETYIPAQAETDPEDNETDITF